MPNLASSLRLKSSLQFPYCSLEEADKASNASKAYKRNLKIKKLILSGAYTHKQTTI